MMENIMMNYKEAQKKEALESMTTLRLRKDIIQEFEKGGCLYCSERPDYIRKLTAEEQEQVESFEERTGSLVYYVMKGYRPYDDWYYFLFISKHETDWKLQKLNLYRGWVLTYLVTDEPIFNEMTSILVMPYYGGLVLLPY